MSRPVAKPRVIVAHDGPEYLEHLQDGGPIYVWSSRNKLVTIEYQELRGVKKYLKKLRKKGTKLPRKAVGHKQTQKLGQPPMQMETR